METVQKTTTTKNLTSELQEAAAKNPVFFDACQLFAARRRARQQVTLHALKIMMKKQGFVYEIPEYQKVLKIMADLGLGTLQYDHRGRLRSLKGIKITLQSIGAAALGKSGRLENFSIRPKMVNLYEKIPQTLVEPAKEVPPPPIASKIPLPNPSNNCKITITVAIDSKPAVFELAKEIPKEELGAFLASIYSKESIEGGGHG